MRTDPRAPPLARARARPRRVRQRRRRRRERERGCHHGSGARDHGRPRPRPPRPTTDTAPARRVRDRRARRRRSRDGGSAGARRTTLDPAKTYSLVVETNCGAFTITLDQKRAPNTAASLVALARDGLLRRHDLPPRRARASSSRAATRPAPARAAPATGRSTCRPPDAAYTTGVVAMAKSGARAAGHLRQPVLRRHRARTRGCRPSTRSSARSPRGSRPSPRSSALGAGDGPPSKPVVIEKVTVEES